MDKNEYRAKLEEISDLVDRQDYKGALKIADTVDWRRVRSARTLCMIGEIYEANKKYDESRKLLLLARQRAPIGKTVVYRLVELSIKMGNYSEASDYYKQFVEIAPNDNSRYILKYKICKAKRSPIEEQIAILQEYKSREYTERWAFELARLYAKAGMKEACIEECDDLILWFSEGKYVVKAMELKMKYTGLTASQQEKYDNRFTNAPSAKATAAANAVTQAAEAAAKLVEQSAPVVEETAEQDKEIEAILNSIVIGDLSDTEQKKDAPAKEEKEAEAAAKTPENLQEKVAQGIRAVLKPKETEKREEEEAAAALEPEEAKDIPTEVNGYVVKDLEPEEETSGFKPFHLGGNMTAKVTAEAPKSEMFKSDYADASAFKTDLKSMEIDLEALLAETANELAQAVAEETEQNTEKMPEEAVEELLPEIAEPEEAQETKELPVKEITEAEQTAETEKTAETGPILVAPAAAKAAMVAESLSAALEAKALEFEKLANNECPKVEEIAEESPETEEVVVLEEEIEVFEKPAEELPEEVTETEQEATKEFPLEAIVEARTEVAEELPEETPAATKVIPVEEIKELSEEMDFSRILEQELENTILPEKEDSHMKCVTGSVTENAADKSVAFNTAVEGLMRHHLTQEEHRKLFTYFAPIPGMTQQITEALNTAQESACAKTSVCGNIIVTGREGSGKTRLSEGLIKALCKERQMEGAKVAFIDAKHLNKKDPVTVVDKMAGGFLVVERAGSLKSEVVENMSKAMEFKTNRLTVILEDLKPGIRSLEEKYPDFMKKFDSRVTIPVFTNDELVSFARTYAKELGYKMDAMAVLALYTLIGDNQNEENPVAIGMVREMMDDAIKRASKKGRRPDKKVSKRHLDENGRVLLYEKDFDV